MVHATHNENGLDTHVTWDSVAECFHDVESLAASVDASTREFDSHQRAREKWSKDRRVSDAAGGWYSTWADRLSADDMRRRIDAPAADLLQQIESMQSRIVDATPALRTDAPRRVRRRGQEWGDEIDVDRFARRDPLCWERMDREARPSRTIKVAIEYSVAAGDTRATLLPRGAALLAFADWLSRNGYSIEIYGVWYATGWTSSWRDAKRTGSQLWKDSRAVGAVCVKPARIPLDTGALATAIAEVSYARLAVLTGMVLHTQAPVSMGWGRVTSMPSSVQRLLGFDVTIPAEVRTEAAAQQWVANTIAKLEAGERTDNGEDVRGIFE